MATCRQHYVILGGGIAGVSCAEELALLAPEAKVTVISSSPLIKAATNVTQQSRVLESFEVEEKRASYLELRCPNVSVITAKVACLRHREKVVQCADGSCVRYDKLCICTGAKPKLIAGHHLRVIGIRDTESVEDFQKRLVHARRIVVVGNGGIATELVHEVTGCEVVWAIKHSSICHTFVDKGASVFFLPHLQTPHMTDNTASATAGPVKRMKYVTEGVREEGKEGEKEEGMEEGKEEEGKEEEEEAKVEGKGVGSALGPDWHTGRTMRGKREESSRPVHVEYQCEVECLLTAEEIASRGLQPSEISTGPLQGSEVGQWPVYVLLTNGKVFGCDLVISATGAEPNTSCVASESGKIELEVAEDGGVVVDREMRTSLPDIYAAGDVCTVHWESHSQFWFQMRLWTQGRQMGVYAARTMVAHTRKEEVMMDFCFELFAHVTKFFGYKVVLLGLFNAQGLENYEVLLRCTKGVEYVKAVLRDGRMVGAILIGETDLEETFENLILNQMDLSGLQESLLDPRVDIEDFFD